MILGFFAHKRLSSLHCGLRRQHCAPAARPPVDAAGEAV
jgi:hypothetical protein